MATNQPTCPTPSDLEQFLLGSLPSEQIDQFECHLAECAHCLLVLENLRPIDDLVGQVRQAPEAVPLVARAALLAAGFPEFPVRSGDTVDTHPRAGVVRYDFLEPPQGANELGRIGAYRILSELGRGGMGVVFKAWQVGLDRLVALKMLLACHSLDPEHLRRFRVEARTVAALDHPHIVRVFEVGEHGGAPYFSLEYLAGGNLATRLTQGPLPPAQAASLCEGIARAMHYAHGQGVIHRDLKPGNILLTPNGTAKVGDFGLAKRLEASRVLTATGQVLGTPAYMAPEQARGETSTVGPAVDIYALGAILYEMLTGRPPFQAPGHVETLWLAANTDPIPPRQLQPGCPHALEVVCLKCLEKTPQRRYRTALELAEDLSAVSEGRPIRARAPGRLERGVRWVRRHPTLSLLLLVTMVVVSTGFALVSWRLQVEQGLRADVEKQQGETKVALGEARAGLYLSALTLARAAWRDREDGRAQHYLRQCPEECRLWEWHYLNRLYHGEPERTLSGHTDNVDGVAYSTDGKSIASVGQDRTMRLWDARSGNLVRVFRNTNAGLHCVAFSPDGQELAVGTWDGRVKVWRISGELRLDVQVHQGILHHLAYGPTGRTLISCCPNEPVQYLDMQSGRVIGSYPAGNAGAGALWPDGKALAVSAAEGGVRIHPLDSSQESYLLPAPEKTHPREVAFHAEGQLVAGLLSNETIRIWNSRLRTVIRDIPAPSLKRLHFRPGKTQVGGLTQTSELALYDWTTGKGTLHCRGHSQAPDNFTFSPDGRQVATASADKTVKVWDVDRPVAVHLLRTHASRIDVVAFSPDGTLLASAAAKDGVRVREVESGREVANFPLPEVRQLFFDPNGRTLAALVANKGVMLLDIPAAQVRPWTFAGAEKAMGIAMHPAGNALAVRIPKQPLRVADYDGTILSTLAGTEKAAHILAFRPDGGQLACVADKTGVELFDLPTGVRALRIEGPERVVPSLAYRPDGEELAIASWDRKIDLCDTRTGTIRRTLVGHPGSIRRVMYSSDGKRLASLASDMAIRLWDVPSGQEVLALPASLTCLALCPKGRYLVGGDSRGTIFIWRGP